MSWGQTGAYGWIWRVNFYSWLGINSMGQGRDPQSGPSPGHKGARLWVHMPRESFKSASAPSPFFSVLARHFPWVLKLKAWLTPKHSAAQPGCAQLPSDPCPPCTTSSGKVFHLEQEQQGFASCCPGWLGAIVFVAWALLPLKFKSWSLYCLFCSLEICGA